VRARANLRRVIHSRLLLLLLLTLTACSSAAPYATTVGVLQPGATLHVRIGRATLDGYQPAVGQPRDRFTVSATALSKTEPPGPPKIKPVRGGIAIEALDPLASLLVRVPDGVALDVDSTQGDVNVTDVAGNVSVRDERGDVRIFLRNSYAQATVGTGTITVAIGATGWPGTLHFSTRRGDVVLSIQENAACTVHLHTDNGTLFTDFDLRGVSQGGSETIDGAINGGGLSRIDVETASGSIRLLRLHAQA